MISRTTTCLMAAVLLLTACTPGNQNRLLKEGKSQLTAEQIFPLVSGNTLQLESIDFNARVHFLANGRMSAKSLENNRDTGIWDINSDKQLCLKFKTWYYGDQKCYTLVENAQDSYIFFAPNGARSYSAALISGDPDKLAIAGKKTDKTFLREKLAGGQSTGFTETAPVISPTVTTTPPIASPPPSPEETRHTMIEMAKNCPNCNLAGADLKGADLITANLAGANLAGADLSHANLRRANLAGANLAGAVMINSNMPGVNLANCNMSNANLTGANLIKANFTGAMTEGLQLQGAHLEGATGLNR